MQVTSHSPTGPSAGAAWEAMTGSGTVTRRAPTGAAVDFQPLNQLPLIECLRDVCPIGAVARSGMFATSSHLGDVRGVLHWVSLG
jgi:hypothetical protein